MRNKQIPIFADYEKYRPLILKDSPEYFTAYQPLPYIKMSDIFGVSWLKSPEHSSRDWREIAEIRTDNETYYVIRYDLKDPSGGIFGGWGSWTPFRVVLFGKDYAEISEHSEVNGVDHIRFDEIRSDESLIRWLTVHRMIRSEFSDEIRRDNEKLVSLYRALYEARRELNETYRKRENNYDAIPSLHDYGNATFEEIIKRNGDLAGILRDDEVKDYGNV